MKSFLSNAEFILLLTSGCEAEQRIDLFPSARGTSPKDGDFFVFTDRFVINDHNLNFRAKTNR